MSSFFRSLGSKKKSKSSLALSDGSDWGGNKTGGSWVETVEERRVEGKEEERRRQQAEERGERLERENNLLRLKVVSHRIILVINHYWIIFTLSSNYLSFSN